MISNSWRPQNEDITHNTFWLSDVSDVHTIVGTECNDVGEPDLVILNTNYQSMVRVWYDEDLIANILSALDTDIESIPKFSRSNFVSDYFAFAENTPLTGVSIEEALENTKFMKKEEEYIVWFMFNQGFDHIWSILKFTENKKTIENYIQYIVQNFYNKKGWNVNLGTVR